QRAPVRRRGRARPRGVRAGARVPRSACRAGPRPVRQGADSMIRRSILLFAALALFACKKDDKGAAPQQRVMAKRPFPVEVQAVTTRDVEYAVTAVGSVDAFEVVQVTARVAGVVDQVRFVEGQKVDKGANLVEIDGERFDLAVKAAKA